MTDTKITICLPAYGQTNFTQTTSSLIALNRELVQRGLDGGFMTLSYPDIVEVRNIFTSIWMDRIQTSHMLFIDADMGFAPQLVLDMLAFDKPLVGALCPKKKVPLEFAGRAKPGDARVVNGHMEVNGIGGALTLIKREVVTSMLAKFPDLDDRVSVKNHAAREILEQNGVQRMIRVFDPLWVDGEKFSEDLSFSIRWQQCGGEIWANIMHEVCHVGLYEYKGLFYETIKDHIRPAEVAA